jgi:hypothetical protein
MPVIAMQCLQMVAAVRDKEIQREKAAEWLKLADAIRRPSKTEQIKVSRLNPAVRDATPNSARRASPPGPPAAPQ